MRVHQQVTALHALGAHNPHTTASAARHLGSHDSILPKLATAVDAPETGGKTRGGATSSSLRAICAITSYGSATCAPADPSQALGCSRRGAGFADPFTGVTGKEAVGVRHQVTNRTPEGSPAILAGWFVAAGAPEIDAEVLIAWYQQ